MKTLKEYNIGFINYYNDYFESISKEFNSWLEGIEEDTPLPYEINLITLMLMKTSNLYIISYSGHETSKLIRMRSGSFHPLEGQYFYNRHIMAIDFISKNENLKRRFIIDLVIELINNFLKTKKANFLKGKKIVTGFAFDKIIDVNKR